ncbi:hypothetical protein KM043_003329 [Ampulex compressa]|nr:hypothetical protein KM043_003329 [Ampulex compressa]
METGYLNFHDEEHFSDFSLSLEQHNLMEKPQDLLMHIVENDFDYMETHLDVANSDSLWSNDQEHNEDTDMLPIADLPTVSKMENIKEDFAKVLTDWQEHIGYLQASDMDEYMDIIGLSMNIGDKKNFYSTENLLQDESPDIVDRDSLAAKEVHSDKQNSQIRHYALEAEHCSNKEIEIAVQEARRNEDIYTPNDRNTKTEIKPVVNKSLDTILEDTQNQNKVHEKTTTYESRISGIDIKGTVKQKKKKKEKLTQSEKDTENDDCIDIETVSDELPVLEARDVKSLLEQFEASENTAITSSSITKVNAESNQSTYVKSSRTQHIACQSEMQVSKKSACQDKNLHKNIRDSLPKEVIDRIKASGRKRVISVIPAMPNTQTGNRSNGTRMQDAAATLSRNKLLKIVTNNAKSRTVDGGLVQLDHDYCSSASSSISGSEGSEYERQSSDSEKSTPVKDSSSRSSQCLVLSTNQAPASRPERCLNSIAGAECWADSNSKKDSGLESGDASDAGEEQVGANTCNDLRVRGAKRPLQDEAGDCQKQTALDQPGGNLSHTASNLELIARPSALQNESPNKASPIYEMKIRSALATSILQLRKGVLTKTKAVKTGHRMKQMVSVLKKPLNAPQPPVVRSNPNESIVTTTNSANDEVQNIIVQETLDAPQGETQKPPRRKLNLEEYRSRREQNRSDSSRTNSPIQPMTLVYVHHASTTTEPIKDDPTNLIWSEREIVSVLKPKADIDEEKIKPKPLTCDVGIQTYETVFEFPTRSLVDIDDRTEEQREKRVRDRKFRSYRKHRIGSSSSRSRSRSRGRSRSSYRSNFGRSKWSSRGRKGRRDRRRSYDRHGRRSPGSYRGYRDWRRSPSNSYRKPYDNWYDREKQRQVEERRVIYVGRLDEGITKADLRRRFEVFGPVVDISVHFREHGDNYGFVTFAYKNDAYEAVEHGNDDPSLPRYDLCFGGRRAFCKVKYADLDGMASSSPGGGPVPQTSEDNTFDLLLKEAKAKLRKRKV